MRSTKDTLSEFGKNSSQPQAAPASSGGCCDPKPIANYSPPKGPTNINDGRSPGLHGENLGNCGTQRG